MNIASKKKTLRDAEDAINAARDILMSLSNQEQHVATEEYLLFVDNNSKVEDLDRMYAASVNHGKLTSLWEELTHLRDRLLIIRLRSKV